MDGTNWLRSQPVPLCRTSEPSRSATGTRATDISRAMPLARSLLHTNETPNSSSPQRLAFALEPRSRYNTCVPICLPAKTMKRSGYSWMSSTMRKFFRGWKRKEVMRISLLFLFLSISSGCGLAPGRHGSPQNAWMSSRYTSSEEAWLYLNFYSEFEDFNRYKGYGIAHYSRDSSRDARTTDEFLISDSLRLCREEFKNAFGDGTLTRWDHTKNGLVPFAPTYIAIVVEDFKRAVPQCGMVVPANLLFSDEPIAKVVASGTIARGKLWYEDITEEQKKQLYSPGLVTRYTHIEEHMAAQNIKKDVDSKPESP